MNSHVDFQQRLLQTLKGLDLEEPEVRVVPGDQFKYLGIVVSRSFEGMDEAERQELVWERVLRTLDRDDQAQIEFIYTDTPSEIAH
ncbi:MAG: hypothetical protein ABI353_20570 [Isosphaeraceae bacterium]